MMETSFFFVHARFRGRKKRTRKKSMFSRTCSAFQSVRVKEKDRDTRKPEYFFWVNMNEVPVVFVFREKVIVVPIRGRKKEKVSED